MDEEYTHIEAIIYCAKRHGTKMLDRGGAVCELRNGTAFRNDQPDAYAFSVSGAPFRVAESGVLEPEYEFEEPRA